MLLYPKAKKCKKRFFLTLLSAAKTEWKDKYWGPILTFQTVLLLRLASSLFHDGGDVVQGQAHVFPMLTHCSGCRSDFLTQSLLVNSEATVAVIKCPYLMAGKHCAQIHVLLLS